VYIDIVDVRAYSGKKLLLVQVKAKVAYLRYDLPEDNIKMTNWFKESAVLKYKKMLYHS
jgi:hypothetical protein